MESEKEKQEVAEKTSFNFRKFWSNLWNLLNVVHRQIFILLVFIMLIEGIKLIGPYLLKLVIDMITNFRPEELRRIIELSVLIFVANQFVSINDYLADKQIFRILVKVMVDISSKAQEKMLFLSLSYHEKENTGNKIIKIQRGADKIQDLLGNFFWEVAPIAFQVVFTSIVLFVVDWRLGFVTFVFVPLFVFVTIRVNRQVFPFRKSRFDQQEEASGKMAQSIININTVKSFVQEKRELKGFVQISKKISQSILSEFWRILGANLQRNLIIDAGRISILLLGVYFVWTNQISIGSLVFVITISEKALISLYGLSRLYDRIMEAGEAVNRIYDLYQEKQDIANPVNGVKPKNIQGEIEFKNVTFSYEGNKEKALEKISVEICPGAVTALVGPSGGGKTTLARMMYRHYDPIEGSVMLDGIDLRQYDLYAFRKFISIVPQEVEIFNSSIRENIAYAKPGASLQEVTAAAKIANAHEFIEGLSQGYSTIVGERGIKLSGGQRQRIGIARAILANPRILIFDEATSNLDSESEKLIQESMDRIRKGRTVIVIAHRLSTIKKADKIVVLEKGKIVEEGSHLELSKIKKGLYQKLLNLQKLGDIEK